MNAASWGTVIGSFSALIVALTGLLAVLHGQHLTHTKQDAANEKLTTANGQTVAEVVEGIADKVRSTPGQVNADTAVAASRETPA